MNPTLVYGGLKALAELERANALGLPFPLVLLDAQMPELDGFSIAREIKTSRSFGEPEIVMLTSAGLRGDAGKCREVGIGAYLTKPVKRSDLLRVIKAALGLHGCEQDSHPLITTHSLRENRRALTILLAEDNRVNQALAIRLLEKKGHVVVLAETGTAVLEAVEKQKFDVLLMDVQMPEMDGLDATIAIRQREQSSGNHLPIIAMTASAMTGDKERCLQSGMDGYIAKPLSVLELFGTIEAVLAHVLPGLDVSLQLNSMRNEPASKI
jgi:two-component system sensor histidine kinase/response regulator